jgi:hypothetical protein
LNRIEKRNLTRWIVGLVLGAGFYIVVVSFQLVYLKPTILDLVFTFCVYLVAWSVRGVHQETKDTMLASMGKVELEAMKAQIEQVLRSEK